MKTYIFIFLVFFITTIFANSAETNSENKDTLTFKIQQNIEVKAARMPIPMRNMTQSASIALPDLLSGIPRSISADEILRLVPGVRIDNQANGERLHLSIRGQGILTERGLRGIKVLIDGISLNDPSGFANDLYDIDWHAVERVEVLRGPSASVYGGGGNGGVLNIITKSGEPGFNKEVMLSGGSNGFIKGFGQVDGISDNINYRLSFSKNKGDGYRDHTAFWGDNLNEKVKWAASDKLSFTQIMTYSDYFNQNAEGLSIDQVAENPKMANPDAVPFNEYQKTTRFTSGLLGDVKISDFQDIQFNGYMRWMKYKETSNKAAQYRQFINPGGGIQYNMHISGVNMKHNISIGSDFQWQTILENKFKSLSNPDRVDSPDEKNLEDSVMLANQTIDQYGIGAYLFYNVEMFGNLNVNFNLRYDKLHNELQDRLNPTYNTSGDKDFDKATARLGASYSISDMFSLFGSWSQGFMPPSTEELASNPVSFAGFNENLVPATSNCEEIGFRGYINDIFAYDVTGFYMTTDKDFFRFKLYPARGNQEVFYGNTGTSKRIGLETYFSVKPVENLNIQVAYTYSNFKYDSPDSLNGVWVPNSPEHQLNLDVKYRLTEDLSVGLSGEMQSKWYIYTDAQHKDLSQAGFTLIHASIDYSLKRLLGFDAEISVFGKNLGDEKYIAFTEPDPDGNCYQPGAGREFFATVRVKF